MNRSLFTVFINDSTTANSKSFLTALLMFDLSVIGSWL